MINLFFKHFEFKNIFLHLESVMSSFGLAIQSSCVVDIGSDKVNICCVDEGMIIENTLIRKNLGGKEITKLLYLITKYLANNNKENNSNNNRFPYEMFNIRDFRDFRIFEKLKENECEFPPILDTGLGINQLTPKKAKIWQHKKGSPTKLINVVIVEEAYLSPLCLFYPKIIETFREKKIPKISWYNDLTGEKFEDSEDVIGELAKIISMSEKKEDNNNNSNNNNSNNNQASSIGSSSPRKNNKDEDDSIIGSPSKSESNKSFSEEKDLKEDLKNNENKINYENIWDLNYGDMKTLSWIGGSILPKLESSKDMWIQKERWLGEPERLEEQIDNNLENSKKEGNNEEKKENENNNLDIGSEGEKSKNMEKSNENSNEGANSNKDGKEKEKEKEKNKDKKDGDNKKKDDGNKKKKIERHLDGGIVLLREKCPFPW